MLGFTIVLLYYFIGLLLQTAFHLPLPANVIGLILFTLSLFLRIVKVEWVEEASAFLIRHMLLFFAPFVVGTIAFIKLIGGQAAVLLISVFGSTFGVLLLAGWTTRLFSPRKAERSERLHESA
ncbi:CidA/LrgA family protein [Paenibacillus filicis]|uniref:CidA/LrgA family protein n=1 Tax=Paenibacillus gyeongsangnamensis TaxID=3388067 RepID=A0ABT4Q8H1_9BACL|nr:CidA/LrgA family protein [Paenibacillus filicis]MCZ8513121.1 CidA/LrgA family protein [Paenibacillus filicis]